MAFVGDDAMSQHVPGFPYAGFAEPISLRGIRVEEPGEVGPARDQLLEGRLVGRR
jgi:hypothetical protein